VQQLHQRDHDFWHRHFVLGRNDKRFRDHHDRDELHRWRVDDDHGWLRHHDHDLDRHDDGWDVNHDRNHDRDRDLDHDHDRDNDDDHERLDDVRGLDDFRVDHDDRWRDHRNNG
jgi:hypothetical protein